MSLYKFSKNKQSVVCCGVHDAPGYDGALYTGSSTRTDLLASQAKYATWHEVLPDSLCDNPTAAALQATARQLWARLSANRGGHRKGALRRQELEDAGH
jgi:hypothetical protein